MRTLNGGELTTCGAPTYSFNKDLAPGKSSDKSYEELVNLVKRHYHPKQGKIVSRYNFSRHHRQDGQSESEFVANLHSPNIVSLQINLKRCYVISL